MTETARLSTAQIPNGWALDASPAGTTLLASVRPGTTTGTAAGSAWTPPTASGLAMDPLPAPLPCTGTGDGCQASRRRTSGAASLLPDAREASVGAFGPPPTPAGTGDGCQASRRRPSEVTPWSSPLAGRTGEVDAGRGGEGPSRRTPIQPAADTTERQITHSDEIIVGRGMISNRWYCHGHRWSIPIRFSAVTSKRATRSRRWPSLFKRSHEERVAIWRQVFSAANEAPPGRSSAKDQPRLPGMPE